MVRGLLVLESPWDRELDSALSVGPFLSGLQEALNVDVASQRFNGKDDLVWYLKRFKERDSGFSYCYIACHGTAGRLDPLLEQKINTVTIAEACRRSRDRGFVIASCSFGNRTTATGFLERTGAAFVAGYSRDVPWMEAMFVDLMFLTYLLRGRCRRIHRDERGGFLADRRGDFKVAQTGDPLKVARWVYEDLPLSRRLGFAVHRRRRIHGRWTIESSEP